MNPMLPLQGGADGACSGRRCMMVWLLVVLWIVGIGVGGLVDRPVSQWVRDSGTAEQVRHHWITPVVKAPGVYYYAMVIAGVFWFLHPLKWRAGGLMLLTGIPGLANCLGKWIFGRARPFKLVGSMEQPAAFELHWFIGGLKGLFWQSNLAFPSGHSCTAFATAAAMAILLPKWRWAFYVVAGMVAVERVLENAHYVSDVIGGAGLGVFGVYVIVEYFRKREARGALGAAASSGCEVKHD